MLHGDRSMLVRSRALAPKSVGLRNNDRPRRPVIVSSSTFNARSCNSWPFSDIPQQLWSHAAPWSMAVLFCLLCIRRFVCGSSLPALFSFVTLTAMRPSGTSCECPVCTEVLSIFSATASDPTSTRVRGLSLPVGVGFPYDTQLQVKTRREQAKYAIAADILPSPPVHHRLRVRYLLGRSPTGELRYGVFEPRVPDSPVFDVLDTPIVSRRIGTAMGALLSILRAGEGLGAAHSVAFLDTLCGTDFHITLWFDEDSYRTHATAENLQSFAKGVLAVLHPDSPRSTAGGVQVVARSRGTKLSAVAGGSTEPDAVTERALFPGRTVRQPATAFSNPNGHVAAEVNAWLERVVKDLVPPGMDLWLLDLCSGCGHHTIGLSPLVAKGLCVEIDSDLCAAARENLIINSIRNVDVVCADMKDISDVLTRHWSLVIDGDARDASRCVMVIVDPPRGGLHPNVTRLLSQLHTRIDLLVYVACGDGLDRDLPILATRYALHRLAFADHFPFTHYLEKVAVFRRRTLEPGLSPPFSRQL